MADLPATQLQMQTLVKQEGQLELSLAEVPVQAPRDDQVVVKILAAPINPSDLGLLVGASDMTTAKATQINGRPALLLRCPPSVCAPWQAVSERQCPLATKRAGSLSRRAMRPRLKP